MFDFMISKVVGTRVLYFESWEASFFLLITRQKHTNSILQET